MGIEHHGFNECFMTRYWNVRRLRVKVLSGIAKDEAQVIFCRQACRSGSPDVTLRIKAESYKKQVEENSRQVCTVATTHQKEKGREATRSGGLESKTKHKVTLIPFSTKFFPKKFEVKFGLNYPQYYFFFCESSPEQG